jgi:hypothetical protein
LFQLVPRDDFPSDGNGLQIRPVSGIAILTNPSLLNEPQKTLQFSLHIRRWKCKFYTKVGLMFIF